MSGSATTGARAPATWPVRLMRAGARVATDAAFRGIVWVAALKAAMILLTFGLIALAARLFDSHDFGVFSILFSAAGLTSILAMFGQSVLVMRSWNEYAAAADLGHLKGYLQFAATVGLAGGALSAAVFYAATRWQTDPVLAMAVTLHMVLHGTLMVSSHLVRSAVGVGTGDGVANLAVLLPANIGMAFALASGAEMRLEHVFFLLAGGAATGLAIHAAVMVRLVRRRLAALPAARPRRKSAEWSRRSLKLWLSTGLEASNQYLDVLIIGVLMSPALAGAYFVITRVANAFAAAADALNMYSTKHLPDLYYRAEHQALRRLLDAVALTTLAVIAVGLSLFLGGGYWVLRLIGPEYTEYLPALLVLCAGTAALTAAGPSASLLMLTGHEGRYLGIMAGSVALRAGLFFLLIPLFDVIGAVTASAISFTIMALALRGSASTLTGMDASVLRLLGYLKGRQAVTPAR